MDKGADGTPFSDLSLGVIKHQYGENKKVTMGSNLTQITLTRSLPRKMTPEIRGWCSIGQEGKLDDISQ